MMKKAIRSLAVIVAASVALGGCGAAMKPTLTIPLYGVMDGKYDNDTRLASESDIKALYDDTQLIVTQCGYLTPDKKEEMRIQVGTGIPVQNTSLQTYIMTAHHVIDCDPTDEYDQPFISKTIYTSNGDHLKQLRLNKKKLAEYIKENPGVATAVTVFTSNPKLDAAILAAPRFENGLDRIYSTGNTDKIELMDYVLIIGYPLSMVKTTTEGHISSLDGPLAEDNPKDNFVFDASTSPGNSGGPVFGLMDGHYEILGFVSHHFTRGNDINVAYKINPVIKMLRGQQQDGEGSDVSPEEKAKDLNLCYTAQDDNQ